METNRATHQEVIDATADHQASMRPQSVPVNLYEASEALVLVAPLPAVTSDDVTVELQGNSLHFWANLRSAGPREYLIQEWEYGGYERTVELPDGFGRGLEASLTNGQLVVRIMRGDNDGRIETKPSSSTA